MVVFLRILELNDMRGAKGSHGPLRVAYRPIAFNFFSTQHKAISQVLIKQVVVKITRRFAKALYWQRYRGFESPLTVDFKRLPTPRANRQAERIRGSIASAGAPLPAVVGRSGLRRPHFTAPLRKPET